MVGKPVSVKGHMHICADIAKPPPRPHVGGPIISTRQKYVKIGFMPIACVGDKALCTGTPLEQAKIKSGSKVCYIGNRRIARMGDQCTHIGGFVTQGTLWVFSE